LGDFTRTGGGILYSPRVSSTPVRLLRLLSLLSTRQSWTNREFAERMEVNERTVRRDGARLLEPASRRR